MMSTMLDDDTFVNHVNHISVLDRAQPMCDCYGGPALCSGIKSRLDHLLAFTVESRCCFIKEENFGIAEQRPSDRDTLLLATRQESCFCANNGVKPISVRNCQSAIRTQNIGARTYGSDMMKS